MDEARTTGAATRLEELRVRARATPLRERKVTADLLLAELRTMSSSADAVGTSSVSPSEEKEG